MNPKPAPALRALLDRSIDYAGMFPPASLPGEVALGNFREYQRHPQAWMLRWLVVPAAELSRLPADLDGQLAVLAETDQPRAAVIESKSVITASRPVYCEVPIMDLPRVQQAGLCAKIRTGGLKPELIPPVAEVADFIRTCAELRLPFKATAGLHHPLRAEQPLTYESNPPRSVQHGFLNVLLAALFAWLGRRELEPILQEADPEAMRFDDQAHWRDLSASLPQIRQARSNFVHAFGSCSFLEPVQDLQALGWL